MKSSENPIVILMVRPLLASSFFRKHPPSTEIWKKWSHLPYWSEICLPIYEWEDILYVACSSKEPPESIDLLKHQLNLHFQNSLSFPSQKPSGGLLIKQFLIVTAQPLEIRECWKRYQHLKAKTDQNKDLLELMYEHNSIENQKTTHDDEEPSETDEVGQEELLDLTQTGAAILGNTALKSVPQKISFSPPQTPASPLLTPSAPPPPPPVPALLRSDLENEEPNPSFLQPLQPNEYEIPEVPITATLEMDPKVSPAPPPHTFSFASPAAPFDLQVPGMSSNMATSTNSTMTSTLTKELHGKSMPPFFDELSIFFHANMLLLIDETILRPLQWSQELNKASQITTVTFEHPSVFRIVFKTKKPYHGYVVSNETNDSFFHSWYQGKNPDHLTLVPILLEEEIIGMLMCIGDHNANTKKSLVLAESVSSKIASWIHSILTSNLSRSKSLYK